VKGGGRSSFKFERKITDGIHKIFKKTKKGGNMNMPVFISNSPAMEKELIRSVAEKIKLEEYKRQIAVGFGNMLYMTRRQILAAFQQEKVAEVEVAFSIYLDTDYFRVKVSVFQHYDNSVDEPETLFPLLASDIKISFNEWDIIRPSLDSGYLGGIEMGNMLAFRFQEGLPIEVKNSISWLATFFRKSIKASDYPCEWVAIKQ